jgi:hypothetical protein
MGAPRYEIYLRVFKLDISQVSAANPEIFFVEIAD